MKRNAFGLMFVPLLLSLAFAASAMAQADLYIRDTPSDDGSEENGDTGPMWVSEDIWVLPEADPNYDPAPGASWPVPAHQTPQYRDPKKALPNYVYVRVTNRGDAASTGTERLRLYWAKAATGLSWDDQWVGYSFTCDGIQRLYADEVTKPRINVVNATDAERDAWLNAVLAIGRTGTAFVFPEPDPADNVTYWRKQDLVHEAGPSNRHGSPAFLPWHRELTNRFEVLLQEVDPTVKLLYWDWTTDPDPAAGKIFTPAFMGLSGRATAGVPSGPPLDVLDGPVITRDLNDSPTTPAAAEGGDLDTFGPDDYQDFRPNLEDPTHSATHEYLLPGGFMGKAAEDPVFFLMHANVDRLWAQWQRDPDPAKVARLQPGNAYGGDNGTEPIDTTMGPWDGVHRTLMNPWLTTDASGYAVAKTPQHASVVTPAIYDTAPLVVPILGPGQSAIIQIPWYPPNPAHFSCFEELEQNHFCLLARIETETVSPFGMASAETEDVHSNTKKNNNIAWKNFTVVDEFASAARVASVLLRNVHDRPISAGLRFATIPATSGQPRSAFSRIVIDLKPELFERWRAGGEHGRGVKAVGGGKIEITEPEALLQDIALAPKETFSVDVHFELRSDYAVSGQRARFDLTQTGAPDRPEAVVGGQRFEVDFSKLVLLRRGSAWRYLDTAPGPGAQWLSPEFDDTKWASGQAELGFGDQPARTIDGGPPERRRITTYFRRAFEVGDPAFVRSLLLRLKRDDGAAVYLNGQQIHRVNLPVNAGPNTVATRDVRGVEEEAFIAVPVKRELLRRGRNVIAVEVHQSSAGSDDLTFDLELSANDAVTRFPPLVAVASPRPGARVQTGDAVTIDVDAFDSDGTIASVQFLVDGTAAGTDSKPPFAFVWSKPSRGRHRLRVVATDNERQQAMTDVSVTVVDNVRPVVHITGPVDGALFDAGEDVLVTSQAADRLGKIVRVDFFVRDADRFIAPERKVGSATASPWSVRIEDLQPGLYMLTAIAVDDGGATNQSSPIHFAVGRTHAGH